MKSLLNNTFWLICLIMSVGDDCLGQSSAIRIMPLGNSITQGEDASISNGVNSFNTYRRILWHELVDTLGYNIDFIGSLNENYPCGNYDNPDFDLDHEGHWAWTVDDIVFGRTDGCNGTGRLGQWIQSVGAPDIALVHLGTNDCWGAQSTTSTISELSAMIDTMRFYNPNVTILLCQIIGHQNGYVQTAIDDLNDSIPVLIDQKNTVQSPIHIVDQASGFDPFTDLYDSAHPNLSGETKMAMRYLEVLAPILETMVEQGDLLEYLINYIDNIPASSGNDYDDPNTNELLIWNTMIGEIMNEHWQTADSLANMLDYELIEFFDMGRQQYYRMLRRKLDGPHWGIYIFNPAACRSELIMMAPHSRADLNTGDEAAYCFINTDAYGLMINGTHRCNHSDASDCSGMTSVCSQNSQPYRISDLAHSDESIWQETVDVLNNNITAPYFIQLHGFAKQPTDPYVILSNGTRDVPSHDPLFQIARYLKIIDPVLSFKIAHIDLSWTRLIGFTNTNGRLINGSADPCASSASESDGRFLHIEQEKTRLRDDSTGWSKMSRAILATFPSQGCISVVPTDLNTTWYVREGMAGDGTGWGSAHSDLDAIIDLSSIGDSIFIATGDYFPYSGNWSDSSFQIRKPISLFGGFPEQGGSMSMRDIEAYPSRFRSAGYGHTLEFSQVVEPALLDGIEIESGSANHAILSIPQSTPVEIRVKNVKVFQSIPQ